MMRGTEDNQLSMFSFVSLEDRVPKDHPLRSIRKMVDKALKDMSRQFAEVYSPRMGRPSIPPEQLLRAMLLQVFYTIRSERLLVEQLNYNLLFRWFTGLAIDDKVWDHSTFSKNRDRLLNTEMCALFFGTIRDQAKKLKLVSNEHFTVDGTLLEAWASMKSFQPKDTDDNTPPDSPGRNREVDFRGKKRTNDTHASTTDPEARLYKKAKGQQARLCYIGHALMENRNGLVMDTVVTNATGTAEREAAIEMIDQIPGEHRITLGADKGYDCRSFVDECRKMKVTAHVSQKQRGSAIDGRTTRHEGYNVSLRIRKRVEEVFGWMKTIGCLDKLRHRGRERVDAVFSFAAAAYNLVRIRNLTAAEYA
jgi:transposase